MRIQYVKLHENKESTQNVYFWGCRQYYTISHLFNILISKLSYEKLEIKCFLKI